jgi:hypothetical protein
MKIHHYITRLVILLQHGLYDTILMSLSVKKEKQTEMKVMAETLVAKMKKGAADVAAKTGAAAENPSAE